VNATSVAIDQAIGQSIADANVSTLSLIFRNCNTASHLLDLVEQLQACKYVFLGQDILFGGYRCLGFRARVGPFESWVSGFGPFSFFAKTRQAPHTEIVARVKPRPAYKKVMKKAPEGVIHLADMEMLGLGDGNFRKLWSSSFDRTAAIIGHKPDQLSTAKTTFVVPVEMNPAPCT